MGQSSMPITGMFYEALNQFTVSQGNQQAFDYDHRHINLGS